MANDVLSLTFASSLTDLCNVNSSFDSGILRIAYAGENQNKSSISKQAFERSIKTIYNCPIVCNYDRESDSLGGHDMELVHDNDGGLRLINATQPVGIIPESARVYWENVEEEDGTEHEYLCAEALLWKRQEAYKKIKEDGITAQSMEITIKDGKTIDGIYYIDDFEFTAFALIGVLPCYESASLTFAKQDFKRQFSEMMLELKDISKQVNASTDDDDIKQKYSMEGGNEVLNKNELIAKYGINVETLDFSIEDFTVEELEEKFKAMQEKEPEQEPEGKFALTNNILDEIRLSLGKETVQSEWGEYPRYCYVDCDLEASEVFCWDTNDWLLYGFQYKANGDRIDIDFACKKRKKYVIADFDEGEQESPFAEVFEKMKQKVNDDVAATTEIKEKYQAASDTITNMKTELNELKQFKADTEKGIAETERKGEIGEVFAKFADLDGTEAFESLKNECDEDCMKYELDVLEEKCYAIRGRQANVAKFSAEKKVPKIKVDKENNETLLYGGLFEKYGFSAKEN